MIRDTARNGLRVGCNENRAVAVVYYAICGDLRNLPNARSGEGVGRLRQLVERSFLGIET